MNKPFVMLMKGIRYNSILDSKEVYHAIYQMLPNDEKIYSNYVSNGWIIIDYIDKPNYDLLPNDLLSQKNWWKLQIENNIVNENYFKEALLNIQNKDTVN